MRGWLSLPLLLLLAVSGAQAESQADARRARETPERARAGLSEEDIALLALARDEVRKDEAELAAFDPVKEGAAPALSAKQCLATYDVKRLAAGYQKDWDWKALVDFPGMFSSLVLYNIAQALRGEDPRLCRSGGALITDELPIGKRGPISVAGICGDFYRDLTWTRAVVSRSPGIKAFCLDSISSMKCVKDEDVGPVCEIMIADAERPKEAAAKIARFHPVLHLDREPDFASALTTLNGLASEETCSIYKTEPENSEKCFAAARFRRARAAGDASLCGSADLCRAMMGEKGAGERFARRAVELFCGDFTRRRPAFQDAAERRRAREALEAQLARDREALRAREAKNR